MTAPDRPRGAFVTIEGGEGGGKSVQTDALVRRLAEAGVAAVGTREPGGSEVAELIRVALLGGRFATLGPKVEALLFAAARIDHLDVTIKPALAAGRWVVCDRFIDSTRAYQGGGASVDPQFLDTLERVSVQGLRPDLTFILDVPARVGMARADARRGTDARPDRFEGESLNFHQGLRRAFLEIATREPDRCVVVDATKPIDQVGEIIWDIVNRRLRAPAAP